MKSPSPHVFKEIVESSPDGILLLDAWDPELKIVYVNSAYEKLSGYSADELIGSRWRLAEPEDDGNEKRLKLRRALGYAEACELNLLDERKDGDSWFCRLQVRPVTGPRGDLQFFLCQQTPIDSNIDTTSSLKVESLRRELGQARQNVANLSRTDAATGLLSFEYFLSLVKRDFNIARREHKAVSVMLFEVVELDTYRRTFGRNAAGSCMRMIAAQVSGVFRRAGDLCARCNESTIIVSGFGLNEDEANNLAARVTEKVRGLGLHNPRAKSGKYLTVNSIVQSRVPDGEDTDDLLERTLDRLKPMLASSQPGESRLSPA